MTILLLTTLFVFGSNIYINHIQRGLRLNDVLYVWFTNISVISLLFFTILDQDKLSKICWAFLCVIISSFILRLFFGRRSLKRNEKVAVLFIFIYTIVGIVGYYFFKLSGQL